MRWDRKLTVFAAGAVLLVALLAAGLLFLTANRMGNVSERIAGAAEEGYADLMDRVAKAENVFRVNVSRRGKFEGQQKYRALRPEWFSEMEIVPGEFLDEDVSYTHTITFRLKSYDTENVYSHRDSPVAYTRYEDGASLQKSGEYYYVTYQTGNTEYHFIVTCPPLTEWLEGIRDTSING